MLTYSDLMNLLLILFIILYSSSRIDAAKAQQIANSIKKGFNTTDMKVGTTPAFAASSGKKTASTPTYKTGDYDYNRLAEALINLVKQKGLQNQVVVQVSSKGIIISLSDAVLFAKGKADIKSDYTNLLVQIGNLLKCVDFSQLVVEGFTDSDPIHTAQFEDNRDLSSKRANNVARLLQYQCGIAADKISSLGYGEYRPFAPNDTEENKSKNRRVVITILKGSVDVDAVIEANNLVSAYNTLTTSQAAQSSQSPQSSKTSSAASSHKVSSAASAKIRASSTG